MRAYSSCAVSATGAGAGQYRSSLTQQELCQGCLRDRELCHGAGEVAWTAEWLAFHQQPPGEVVHFGNAFWPTWHDAVTDIAS
jgi:hypothetical protein